jgi:hypothetical protein
MAKLGDTQVSKAAQEAPWYAIPQAMRNGSKAFGKTALTTSERHSGRSAGMDETAELCRFPELS